MLTHLEQAQWFEGCTFVTELARIMSSRMSAFQLDAVQCRVWRQAVFGTSAGKTTDEAWKAATRGTQFKVPIVDHTRFVPSRGFMEVIHDDLGRKGVNIYKPGQPWPA